ncbi:hypothetical protein HO173_010012 [Letharia columbiana]|uniref:UDP-galactose transporter n=1 Tax=Letharia columbiana TaxID=112416 RepID=A0A8H6FNE0_9LECA|nr:uncharacterized protein HO173_010012 [Letharia columbiana]KAF6231710.1 hypothetical protein HO173_010012 [Letharia columbiana]
MLRSSLSSTVAGWSPAYAAALALVAIQVGIGIVYKIAQKGGSYTFSTSSSITISEFLKCALSTFLFYRECRRRHAARGFAYQVAAATPERLSLEEKDDSRTFSETSTLEEGKEGSEDHVKIPLSPDARGGELTLEEFWNYCKNEVPMDTKYGFFTLALLYALINNTIFVAYKLADPGTIQLLKSGITLVTALVMLFALGTRIVKLQWIAIIIQICGLMVTQYHPDTGASYPLSTYTLLIFQTFLSASAGVYNQSLCKRGTASLHGDNQTLYASGAAINLVIHIIMKIMKPDEPSFFTGYNSIGAIMVVLSNVFIGLAITAVYKYADAIIKCFATAVSTGILLYLSPILFGAEMSFLVLPGTLVVFISTWLYMEAAPPKPSPNSVPEQTPPTMLSQASERVSAKHWNRHITTGFSTFLTIIIIVWLSLGNSHMPDKGASKAPEVDALNSNSTVTKLESPFKNSMAFIRINGDRPERIPTVMGYEPFFRETHISMPNLTPNKHQLNLTHDSFEQTFTAYKALGDTMKLILDAPANDSASKIDGIFFFHFDIWLDPMAFAHEDFENIWLPDMEGPRYLCMTEKTRDKIMGDWFWFDRGAQHPAIDAAREVHDRFGQDFRMKGDEFCAGWADLYYIPRRFFAEWIILSTIYASHDVFHEIAVASMARIIDVSRRSHPTLPVMTHFGDCWGGCCSGYPEGPEILWKRCGHHLNYLNQEHVKTQYGRLEREAKMLGSNITEIVRGKEDDRRMLKELGGLMEAVGGDTGTDDSWSKHW